MLAEREKMKTRKQAIDKRAGKCGRRILISGVALLLATTCLHILSARLKAKSEANKTPATAEVFDDPLALVLTPQLGDSRNDGEISRLQQQIRNGRNLQLGLEHFLPEKIMT